MSARLTNDHEGGTLESMRILTRYLLRLHLAPFFFAVTGLTLLLLLDQVSRRFKDLIGKGLRWSVIVEVFVYSIPFILAQTLPMAVLIAVLYAFNRLAGDLEITAIRASGVPLAKVMMPILLASTILAGGMTWFNNTILPDANHHLQVLLTGIGRKKPTFYLRERAINEVLPSRLYVQPGRLDRERSTIEDVTIYDEREGQKSRTIYADSGRMAFGPKGTDLFFTLRDGTLNERPNDAPHTFQRTQFARMVMRVGDVGNQLERDTISGFRSDREMNIQDMHAEVLKGERQVTEARAESRAYAVAVVHLLTGRGVPMETAIPVDTSGEEISPLRLNPRPRESGSIRMPEPGDGENAAAAVAQSDPPSPDSLAARGRAAAERYNAAIDGVNQFESYRQREDHGLDEMSKYWVEIHKKGSIPAACIVFVLIGAPIAVRYPRAGVALVVGVSLVFFGAFYVSLVGGEELADRRFISPLWAMWAPDILFGIIGIGALIQATRVTRS